VEGTTWTGGNDKVLNTAVDARLLSELFMDEDLNTKYEEPRPKEVWLRLHELLSRRFAQIRPKRPPPKPFWTGGQWRYTNTKSPRATCT